MSNISLLKRTALKQLGNSPPGIKYVLKIVWRKGHFRVAFPFGSLSAHLSNGNEFFLHLHCLANQTYFHLKGYAPRLVLKQRTSRQLGDGLFDQFTSIFNS